MPDAGRTREPCVLNKLHIAHASNDRFSRNTGIPRAMVLTAASCSPRCTGPDSHRRLALVTPRLDPSVGGSGPHDLAVRIARARLSRQMRPPHPAANARDDREAPLVVGAGR